MKSKTAGVSLCRRGVNLWSVCYNKDRNKTVLEVKGTSGGDCYHLWERVDVGLGKQGGRTHTHTQAAAPTSLLWHWDEMQHPISRLHVALTHAQMQGRCTRAQNTHSLGLGRPRSIQHFNPADISAVIWHFAVLNVCLTVLRSCQKAFMGGFAEWEMHQSPCGLATNQSCNTDRGNKSKEQSNSQSDQILLSRCCSRFTFLKAHTPPKQNS